jgi:hypothetical protein
MNFRKMCGEELYKPGTNLCVKVWWRESIEVRSTKI